MWQLDLVGEDIDVAEIKRLAQACDCTIVTNEDGRPCLTGRRFNSISDLDGVRREAAAVLKTLNGLALLEHSDHRPVQLGSATSRRDEEGSRHIALSLQPVSLRMRVSPLGMTVTRANGDIEVAPSSRQPIERATRVFREPKLIEVVQVLGGEISWQRLRVAFERLSALIGRGDNDLVKHGYCTQVEIRKFKANIEDPRLSGDDAVHGVPKGPPRGEKMTEAEGSAFVARLVDEYVRRLDQGKSPDQQ